MDEASPDIDIVSDSPTAVDFNVYDRAYENAVEQITSATQQNTSQKPTVFLTKFVKDVPHLPDGVQPAAAPDLPPSSPGTLARLASELEIKDNGRA